jgi:PAS domain-containing protein
MFHFSRSLERLPLRYRLLIAPFLGLALIAVLSAGVLFEAQRQNALVTRIAEQDLARLDRYTVLIVGLTEQHTAIFDLLNEAHGQIDEEVLYDRAKQHLDRVRSAVANLEREILADPARGSGTQSDAMRSSLLGQARGYGQAAGSAVELSTVDTTLAGKSLALANKRFVSMSKAFTGFLEARRRESVAEIAQSVERNRRNIAVIMVGGVLLGALLLAIALVLSRRLTRLLEAQLQSLAALGESAGAQLDPQRGSDEVARIAAAIATFRDVLLRLKEHERALQAAHDELERRVEERTRQLSEANAELQIYSAVVRSTGEAVAITGPDGTIIDVNPAFELATGYTRADMIGTPLYCEATAPEGEPTPAEL